MNDELNLTYNLNSIIESLENFQREQFAVAFMNIKDENETTMLSWLKQDIRTALETHPEFSIPEFSKPLMEAIDDIDIISIIPRRDLEGVWVDINMRDYAGDIEDYAEAIDTARYAGGFGIHGDSARASEIWKKFIYQPAREGSPEGDPDIYWNTIELRRQYYQSLAPYWYLLEYGNSTVQLSSSKGGTPYPKYGPTGVIARTERLIERYLTEELKKALEVVLEETKRELGKAYDILAEVQSVLTDSKYKTPRYQEPQILKEYEIAQRRYYLYITVTGKLGFSLRPEI